MKITKNVQKWTLLLFIVAAIAYLVLDRTLLVPDGATTLSWTTPTRDERDEPLTDLAGYKIYCWNEVEGFSKTFRVEDPDTTSFVADGLSPGEYSCAISAIDQDGNESALSNVVAKSVR